MRVIGVIENQAPTRALEADLPVEDGLVAMDRRNDVCQIALVERHRGTGQVTNGFVSGFGYVEDCAMASTVAHDCAPHDRRRHQQGRHGAGGQSAG